MADIATPMTPGDQVLAMAVTTIVTDRVIEPRRRAMHMDVLARALTKSAGDNPFVVRLRSKAEVFQRLPHDLVARCQMEDALHAWAEWRLGLALNREEAA